MTHRRTSPVLMLCSVLLVLAVVVPDGRTAGSSTRPVDRPRATTSPPVGSQPAAAPLHVESVRTIDRPDERALCSDVDPDR